MKNREKDNKVKSRNGKRVRQVEKVETWTKIEKKDIETDRKTERCGQQTDIDRLTIPFTFVEQKH